MKRVVTILTLSLFLLQAKVIEPISSQLQDKMLQTGVYKEGCPVSLSSLRLVTVAYKDFNGELKEGKIVVHRDIAKEVVQIFNRLVKLNYPIEKVTPISDYGSYLSAISANVTYGFDCRVDLHNPKKWSKHAYGKAIDINPMQNPYVDGSKILPSSSKRYTKSNRRHISIVADNRAMLLKTDAVVELLKSKTWVWGGDFIAYKNYSHFEKEISEDENILPITQQNLKEAEPTKQKSKVKELFKTIPNEDSGLF